ncbi:MAG TPA: STAS domain-containing protein [bacterium]|nr:STAS domain-containing protein [bacterium]
MEKFRIETEDRTLRIMPEEDILRHSCPRLERLLNRLLSSGVKINVDLNMVEYISSSGVGLLIKLKNIADACDLGFELTNPGYNVQKKLRRLHLADFLNATEPLRVVEAGDYKIAEALPSHSLQTASAS